MSDPTGGGGTPLRYFEQMYADDPDPWQFETSWYEQRKRALTVAALPDQRYRRAFEPGCANGALTEQLAQRCDEVLATDIVPAVVARARDRLAPLAGVRVEQRCVPDEWPDGSFDLVVLSEVAYYLDPPAMSRLLDRLCDSLAPGGVVAAVHWRGRTDYPLRAEETHRLLGASPWLSRVGHYEQAEFVLDVWRR